MASQKCCCEQCVISLQVEHEWAELNCCYDINIFVSEEVVKASCVVSVCSELTESEKEKFGQQQPTVKWVEETQKRERKFPSEVVKMDLSSRSTPGKETNT